MVSNPYGQYRAAQVETAGPEALVVLAYDGARRFTDQACAAMEADRLDEASRLTGKAQAILLELAANLNFEAGEIAQSLDQMYDYWNWRLSQALMQHDAEAYREVSGHLVEFYEAWTEAGRQVRMTRKGVVAHG